MKVSILGNGLTSLALAKMLVNHGITVDIFSNEKIKKNSKTQTLSVSKTNIEFFNKNILNINKILWRIDKIDIYSENLKNEKILDFQNNKEQLFSILKNADLYNLLFSNLKNNKFVKFKKNINYQNLIKKNYDLIFNCDYRNLITKKFFYKKMDKDYNSFAYVTTIEHSKLPNNHIASQIFTKKGPLAFLPISAIETSIVYSVKGNTDLDLNNLIKKYNTKYDILKINSFLKFKLKSLNLRSYYYKNILAFGDLLHRLHPLAGQGFNMTIRDMKEIIKLIMLKKENGLELDSTICSDFEKNTKSKNYLFAYGVDLIYEIFNIENKISNTPISRSIKFLGKNKIMNKFFTKFADNGIVT